MERSNQSAAVPKLISEQQANIISFVRQKLRLERATRIELVFLA